MCKKQRDKEKKKRDKKCDENEIKENCKTCVWKKKMFEGIFVQERLLICGICGATQEGRDSGGIWRTEF